MWSAEASRAIGITVDVGPLTTTAAKIPAGSSIVVVNVTSTSHRPSARCRRATPPYVLNRAGACVVVAPERDRLTGDPADPSRGPHARESSTDASLGTLVGERWWGRNRECCGGEPGTLLVAASCT
jgi:hypothetical protein